jgi:hypothetical protein
LKREENTNLAAKEQWPQYPLACPLLHAFAFELKPTITKHISRNTMDKNWVT